MDKLIAEQFALMLGSGMPPAEIIPYFLPDEQPDLQKATLAKWLKSKELQAAVRHNQGKGWPEMSVEEKLRFSIDKHYTEMAYFLYSHNYSELQGSEKTKADTCRQALEARLAGMAGKVDALSRFFDDLSSGRLSIGKAAPSLPSKGLN